MSRETIHYKKVKRIDTGSKNIRCWIAKNSENKKVLLTYPNLAEKKNSSNTVNLFREKAKRAISLSEHPNIAKTHLLAYDELEKQDFMVTDFIDGKTIDIAVQGMHAKQIASLYLNVLSALEHIHHANMLHLNLKPRLIIVGSDDNGKKIAKLSDCGFLLPKGLHEYSVIGSTHIVAPELVLEHFADERSDLYSLGILMHHSIHNAFPFKRPLRVGDKLVRAIKNETIPDSSSITQSAKGMNEAFETIIRRLLDKNPDNRFENATAVKKAILKVYPDISNG